MRGWPRELAFAALNLAAVYWLFFRDDRQAAPAFGLYVALVVIQYGMLRLFAKRPGALPWLAFFTPILFLVLVRFLPAASNNRMHFPFAAFLVGISYLSFRSSHL